MQLTQTRATFGLNAKATPTSSNVIGTVQIGASNKAVIFPDADVAYSLRAIFAGSGDELALTLQGAVTTGSTAFVAGAAQVETAIVTAGSGITTDGNATVTVTAAGMTGSPKAISVPLTAAAHTSATLIAVAIATALNADTAYAAMFTATSSGANVITTRKPTSTHTVPGGTLNLYAANDGTLNIALANGTCAGITTAATSTNTTAGVISDGVKIYDNATDFEGNAIPAIITTVNAVLLSSTGASAVNFAGLTNDVFSVAAGSTVMFAGGTTSGFEDGGVFTAAGVADLTITVVGTTA
jgi:hypothetical protein